VLGALGFNPVTLVANDSFWSWWLHLRKTVSKGLRKAFDSLVFIIGWHLWKERNSRTFNNKLSSPAEVLLTIIEEAHLWILAGYRHLGCLAPLATSSHNVPSNQAL